jgi:hypothetical protein
MAEHPEGVPFRIIISGIRNPDSADPLSGFRVSTEFQGNIINERTNFITITLDGAYTPGTILSDAIELFPTNN